MKNRARLIEAAADLFYRQGYQATSVEDVIAAIIYPDRRGDGFGIGRYEDHPNLDFSRVEDQPDVHFAHKSGFMCKTSATDPDRLKELVAMGWKTTA